MTWGCLMGWDGVNPFAEPFFTRVYKRSSGLALVANRCRNEGPQCFHKEEHFSVCCWPCQVLC